MTARVTPYLNFGGNAREAMEFYHSVFGGTLDITTYADLHRAEGAGQEDLVAHAMLRGAVGVVLMGSDTPIPEAQGPGGSFSVALRAVP
ncbi:hypothetical protein [Streptomyces sp. NPDC059466]|uniref:hypothetical protein n=1 Tax=unclassified Streptomyces TaxID=2593676 RepID=UPI0036C0158D